MTRTITMLLLLTAVSVVQARDQLPVENPYGGVHMIRGTVVSVGRVDPSLSGVDTGFFADINYTSVALNAGINTKKLGDSPLRDTEPASEEAEAARERVNNAYVGVGFGRIAQLQFGYGNQGQVTRLRSDINFRSIVDFITQESTPKHRLTLADRITFSYTIERYTGDEDIFDNFTWGVGLLF